MAPLRPHHPALPGDDLVLDPAHCADTLAHLLACAAGSCVSLSSVLGRRRDGSPMAQVRVAVGAVVAVTGVETARGAWAALADEPGRTLQAGRMWLDQVIRAAERCEAEAAGRAAP